MHGNTFYIIAIIRAQYFIIILAVQYLAETHTEICLFLENVFQICKSQSVFAAASLFFSASKSNCLESNETKAQLLLGLTLLLYSLGWNVYLSRLNHTFKTWGRQMYEY